MVANEQVRIDVEAAQALAQWKFRFADEVCQQAKRLAAQSNQPSAVTLSHYRQAAKLAIQSLADAIHNEDSRDAQPEAA